MIRTIDNGKITISKTPTKLPTKDTNLCKYFWSAIASKVIIAKNIKFLTFLNLSIGSKSIFFSMTISSVGTA